MLAEETTRTWQYLDSLRNFSSDDRLEVCVLVHKNDRATVESALRDFAQLQYRLLDMDEVAIKLGLKPAPLDSTAEEVMVHLFLLRKAPNHFATPEMRRYAVRRSARILISQLSLAVIAAGLVWGGWNLWGRIPGERGRSRRIPTGDSAQSRERRDPALAAVLRRGWLDDARRRHVLQRRAAPLSRDHGFSSCRSRTCCVPTPT